MVSGRSCSVTLCKSRYVKGNNLTFHKFPKDERLRKEWVEAVQREKEWRPGKCATVCSRHFTAEAFEVGGATRRLRQGAVPSVFPEFPANMQKRAKKLAKKRAAEAAARAAENEALSSSEPAAGACSSAFTNDHCYMPSPTVQKRKYEAAQQELANAKKRLRFNSLRISRMSHTTAKLKALIRRLKERDLVSDKCDSAEEVLSKMSEVARELFLNEKNNSKANPGNRYSEAIKQFALTIYFYSPQAYEYMRTIFTLPASMTVSNWMTTMVANPVAIEQLEQPLIPPTDLGQLV